MNILEFITSIGKNLSLRKKFVLIILTASNTALLLASIAVIFYDRKSTEDTMQQELRVLSSVIAQRSAAAMAFQDKQLAEENLHSLAEKRSVMTACIYDKSGHLFAGYRSIKAAESCSQTELVMENGFINGGYVVKQAVMLDSASMGSLYVITNLDDINQRLIRFVVIVALIFIVAGSIAFMLAVNLQKIITRPIDDLAEVARKIHSDKSYAIRVKQVTNDEVGQLVVAFNDMLAGIEDRDEMLVDAKKNLEEIVRERTAELKDAQNELIRKDRMATLGQLTATVSHELRNPLGTIRTSVFTLSNRIGKQDEFIKNIMQRIDRNIVRCDSIITELLDYSRIRALQHQRTNLGVWIRALMDEIDMPEDVSVTLNLDDSIEAEIDRDLFRRVIVNVVENASQAIQSKPDSNNVKKIFVECHMTANRVEVVITDSGTGIPADVLPRIFDPLFSTRSFGIGLGLSIVRQIMLQHGGNIEIVSESGAGTRVVLWLPSVKQSALPPVQLIAEGRS